MLSQQAAILPFPQSTEKTYRYWRFRIMYTIMIGYAGFYLIRQNFAMAIPYMEKDLGFSKTDIGWIMTVGALLYGLGKGIFGLLGDRSNARYFMAAGLLGSAIMNLFVGMTSLFPLLMVGWVLNQSFQSMGWPPCARLLAHWFSPKEIATRWAVWNTSQQIGAACAMLLSAFMIEHFGWRYIFYAPGIIAVAIAFFLINRLRDTPQSLGLPPIEVYKGLQKHSHPNADDLLSFRQLLLKKVLKNRLVWYVSLANFFVYIVRMSVFNWAPTFLREFKGSSLYMAGWQSAAFDIAGMFGGILAGYLSDKIFKGYRGRVGSLFMGFLGLGVLFLWLAPAGHPFFHSLGMVWIGFFVSGPQILVGVAAADFASKRAAGAASGFTGVFGYLGTAVTGVGIGYLVDSHGWDWAFAGVLASAFLSALFFLLIWNHRSAVLDNLEEEADLVKEVA